MMQTNPASIHIHKVCYAVFLLPLIVFISLPITSSIPAFYLTQDSIRIAIFILLNKTRLGSILNYNDSYTWLGSPGH